MLIMVIYTPLLSKLPMEKTRIREDCPDAIDLFETILAHTSGQVIGATRNHRLDENDEIVTGEEALALIVEDENRAIYDNQLTRLDICKGQPLGGTLVTRHIINGIVLAEEETIRPHYTNPQQRSKYRHRIFGRRISWQNYAAFMECVDMILKERRLWHDDKREIPEEIATKIEEIRARALEATG
ncbi:hypothetical protein ACFL2V_08340 [Pseudomonadota bacterium]